MSHLTWLCVMLSTSFALTAKVPPSTSVTDILWTGLENVFQQRSGLTGETKQVPEKRCECQSPEMKSCVCCLKMSLPLLDLTTSPGCVKFKYVPDIESFAVNVTYGKGNIQNGVIKGDNPEPVCMDVLAGFGQLCARFIGNLTTLKNYDGCLKLEATLLNEVQNSISMGCYKLDQQRLIFNSTIEEPETLSNSTNGESGSEETEEEEGGDSSEEELMQVFGETAVQGVTWLASVMGVNFNQSINSLETSSSTEKQPTTSQQSQNS
ncbi:uncharacterized protein LOC126894195 [Daktulosphaira vitifoliae]|uniref:uncharacterized protein LOC126894195 n=1 Tax=Daktulosphaira vitifoliae TaxID=58002 RepID=UPI0021A98BE3|nr:uncharacterized protein LOC126894195 [Daktulosphaira vitifoliae]